jgi:hypothetical protein
MNFNDIPQLPRAHYEIDIGWDYLEEHLKSWEDRGAKREFGGVDYSPDYQRAHVWTREQQIAYVEYILQGGEVGRNITWNCSTWNTTYTTPMELVDGKQRLEAVRSFLRDGFPVFGHVYSSFTGRIRSVLVGFKFRVCQLQTREEVLNLYLNINAGGTPHTAAELDKVRKLLSAEVTPPLSREAAEDRRPSPPSELVGALHDTVHVEVGRGRPARTVRNKRTSS